MMVATASLWSMLMLLFVTSAVVVSAHEDAAEHAQHTVVLTIVIVELVFAFAVGITCVLFSVNLYRALLKEAELEEQDATNRNSDALPPNYVVRDTFVTPPSGSGSGSGRRSAGNIHHSHHSYAPVNSSDPTTMNIENSNPNYNNNNNNSNNNNNNNNDGNTVDVDNFMDGDIDDCASDDYELEHDARRRAGNRKSTFRSAVASFTAYLRFW
jgi:hypothetical protein